MADYKLDAILLTGGTSLTYFAGARWGNSERLMAIVLSAITLRPGMVFSDEPGIYIRGEFGIRLEDDMVITDTGAELFTPQSQSIEDPFAK